jgi:outer membrane murein-binding lipoprotein Lpp
MCFPLAVQRATIRADMPLLTFVLVSLMLFGTACNQDKIARLEKQNQELAAKLDAIAKAANLDTQAKCAQQARIAFNESGLDKQAMRGYTNHYNQKLNSCFVRLNSLKAAGKDLATYTSVQDAFEGKSYAEYFSANIKGEPPWSVKPSVCMVTMASGEDKDCESKKEFEELVKVYMEQ